MLGLESPGTATGEERQAQGPGPCRGCYPPAHLLLAHLPVQQLEARDPIWTGAAPQLEQGRAGLGCCGAPG